MLPSKVTSTLNYVHKNKQGRRKWKIFLKFNFRYGYFFFLFLLWPLLTGLSANLCFHSKLGSYLEHHLEKQHGIRTTQKGPGRVPQKARLQAHSACTDRCSTADLGTCVSIANWKANGAHRTVNSGRVGIPDPFYTAWPMGGGADQYLWISEWINE